MKPQQLFETDIIQESFGPRERILKQVSKARRINPSVYPAGKKGNCPDVYALQACRVIMLLAFDPNPANQQAVNEATNRILQMESFLNDFAWILENDGESLSGQKVRAVLICTERAFARIEFEGSAQNIYGEPGNQTQIENFAVLRPEVLRRFSHLMKTTPRDGSTDQVK